jgi:hypothetical protein
MQGVFKNGKQNKDQINDITDLCIFDIDNKTVLLIVKLDLIFF